MIRLLLFFTCLSLATICLSQTRSANKDTLKISLQTAEKLFRQRSLVLIQQHYEIDKAAAAEIDAKLIPNPELSFEHNLYNPTTTQVLDAGASGQSVVSVSQIIELGGKRSKRLSVALANKRLTLEQYNSLVIELLHDLRISFKRLNYLDFAIKVYDNEVPGLRKLVSEVEQQVNKGNLALTESVRLKALLVSFQQSRFALASEATELQHHILLMLNERQSIVIEPIVTELDLRSTDYKLDSLISIAIQARPELRIQVSEEQCALENIKLQQSLAVPDVVTGYTFDRRGSAWDNYSAVNVGLSIPLLNRNQGQIQLAKVALDQTRQRQQLIVKQIEQDVATALSKYSLARALKEDLVNTSSKTFNQLQDAAVENYRKGNLSLIQFIDYYVTYTESQINLAMVNYQYHDAYEKLRYAVGNKLD